MTLGTALQQGTRLLSDEGLPVPRLTAEVLLAHAVQRDRVWLFSHADDELNETGWIHYGRYLHRRLSGIPTQYITRKQEFYGREFHVSPAVLIPRPETEHVVSSALERLAPGNLVVDAGTGSGAIAVSLALERGDAVRVTATDISSEALSVADRNARTLHAAVSLVQCDLVSALSTRSVDMIVSNPPYVALQDRDGLQREVRDHEPAVALFAGPDGNALYRRLIEDASRVLRPGGYIVLELGYRSLEAVQDMLRTRWSEIDEVDDLAGIPRVIVARYTGTA